jgi:hypothetical protein
MSRYNHHSLSRCPSCCGRLLQLAQIGGVAHADYERRVYISVIDTHCVDCKRTLLACAKVAVPFSCVVVPSDISISQHTSAYVSIRQHTSAYVSIRQHTCLLCRSTLTRINTDSSEHYLSSLKGKAGSCER